MKESASHHVNASGSCILRGSASEKLISMGLWASVSIVSIKNQIFQKILKSSFSFWLEAFGLTPELLKIVQGSLQCKEKCICALSRRVYEIFNWFLKKVGKYINLLESWGFHPEGQPRSRRWRRVLRTMSIKVFLLFCAAAQAKNRFRRVSGLQIQLFSSKTNFFKKS